MEKKVLLIADDEEMNRRIIHKFLKDTYDVIEAEDGQQALELVEQQKVDMILLDIIMPRMDGLEVLRQIRTMESGDNIGILVATSTKEKTERTALSLGADDIVSKTYDPIVIKKRLENVLAARQRGSAFEAVLSQSEIEDKLQQIRQFGNKLEDSLKQFHIYSTIIMENSDNPKLVSEVAIQMERENETLTELLKEQHE